MRTRRVWDGAVVGLDLSLSRPAACFIPEAWEVGDWSALRYESWEFEKEKTATLREECRARYVRIVKIVGKVVEFVCANRCGNVFVESYAFSARSTSVTALAELGGVARVELFSHGRTTIPITASFARKILLGRLPREHVKVAVQQALYAAGAKFTNDDECDAFVVANAGRSELGLPCLTLANSCGVTYSIPDERAAR